MAREKISGVYMIRNVVNLRCYIGSSLNIYRRWEAHKRDARRGEHHSATLQADWDELGIKAFKLMILEELPPIQERLCFNEQNSIWLFEPKYNSTGLVRPHNLSDDYRKKLSDRMTLQNKNRANAKRTPEAVRNYVVSRMKLSETQVHEIVRLYNEGKNQKELSIMFNANSTAIWRVINNKICIYPNMGANKRLPGTFKLTDDDVRSIRIFINSDNRPSSEIAAIYGVTQSTIRAIATRRSRKDVEQKNPGISGAVLQ